MTNPEGMLDRIRKLLAKAEAKGTTPEEKSLLMDKVSELIAKYGVDTALLANEQQLREEVGRRTIYVPFGYANEKAVLLQLIAGACSCRSIRIKIPERRNEGTSYNVNVFGFEADLDRVELLYTSLLVQMAGELPTSVPWGEYVGLPAYRRSWINGYSKSINERLWLSKRRAEQEAAAERGPGTDLVLKSRMDEVDQAYKAAFPNSVHSKTNYSSEGGYAAGRQSGREADLGGTRISPNKVARGRAIGQ